MPAETVSPMYPCLRTIIADSFPRKPELPSQNPNIGPRDRETQFVRKLFPPHRDVASKIWFLMPRNIVILSAYTKLIVYFIIRLIGRLKPGLHKQSLPSETEEIQRAQAGFALRAR